MDLSFDLEGMRLNLKATGILLREGKILLHSYPKAGDHWMTIGGRIHLGEATDAAIVREFQEELSITPKVVRLLWVVENFFTYQEKPFHEFNFIYLLQETDPLGNEVEFEREDTDGQLQKFRWFMPEELEELFLVPAFLKQALQTIPKATEHIIWRDQI